MLEFARPASNVDESKERLTKFRDVIIKQI
jgi:hypothetical protein